MKLHKVLRDWPSPQKTFYQGWGITKKNVIGVWEWGEGTKGRGKHILQLHVHLYLDVCHWHFHAPTDLKEDPPVYTMSFTQIDS